MKKLLTILVIILGMVTMVNGQGWMFYSMDEVDKGIIETEQVKGEGVTDDGLTYVTLNNDHFEWILFFDGEIDIVYESHFICKSYDAFLWALTELDKPNNKMLRQGEGHWIYMMGNGAIDVKTYKKDYSDYPVFIYTYKTY